MKATEQVNAPCAVDHYDPFSLEAGHEAKNHVESKNKIEEELDDIEDPTRKILLFEESW